MDRSAAWERYLPPKAAISEYGRIAAYELQPGAVVEECRRLYRDLPLKIITAFDERQETGAFRIMYLFGVPRENRFLAPFIRVREAFPSLTPVIHEASTYERKIKTFFGLIPEGHPDPRSIILHENWPAGLFPLRKDFPWDSRPPEAAGEFPFRRIGGEGVYEIPVGPVHAGIIEPGHFRFSVAGEEILFLEPRLGYSHRGCEKLFETLAPADRLRLAERISGDSSYGHSLAFCLALEELGGTRPGEKAGFLRVLFSELERIGNHLGDIGAIMTDAGFNFGGAQGARLREKVMQMNEALTGSRFLRGVNRIGGGIPRQITAETARLIAGDLRGLLAEFSAVMAVADNSHSLLNRLEHTGTLPAQTARDHGVIGVAGKAVGFSVDARVDYPYAAYGTLVPEVVTETGGDVLARFTVRVREVRNSLDLARRALGGLSAADDPVAPGAGALAPNSYALGIVEGWRGDIVHLVATDARGEISRVDVRDPSFLNWTALSYAAVGNVVPDFPLINKSFNLSYSGNDL